MEKPRADWPAEGRSHPDGLLTAAEVAGRLRISVSQVYALHASGKLPAYRLTTKLQGGLRFAEKHLASLLETSERAGGAGEDDKTQNPEGGHER